MRTVYALSASLIVILAVALVPVLSQEAKPEKPADDVMQKWMELHQPGAEHKWLAEQVGEWKVEGKMWQQGISEPTAMSGTSSVQLLHDRYLHEEATMGEGEMEMKHTGYVGFNQGNKQYQAIYFGNFGTGLKVMDGKRSGDTLTFTCTMDEPELKLKGSSRVIIARESKDKYTVTMFEKFNDKPEYKSMELIYTR
jgi:hypothetical protein